MKKIFIIKSTMAEKEVGLTKENVWINLYAVENEKEAREDCIQFQNKANDSYIGCYYKFYYIYEELELI